MTTSTPAARSASTACRTTARFSDASVRPFGPSAPRSSPPWPGSSTTVADASGVPVDTVAARPHGVRTRQPPATCPSTGTTTPVGVRMARADEAGTTGTGGRTAVVVVVGPGAGSVDVVARGAVVVDLEVVV